MNERILNLLSLCMQAKEKGHDVFFSYSPHCNMVSIEAHLPHWVECPKDADGKYIPGADNCKWKTYFYIVGHNHDDQEDAKISEAEVYLKGLIA